MGDKEAGEKTDFSPSLGDVRMCKSEKRIDCG